MIFTTPTQKKLKFTSELFYCRCFINSPETNALALDLFIVITQYAHNIGILKLHFKHRAYNSLHSILIELTF